MTALEAESELTRLAARAQHEPAAVEELLARIRPKVLQYCRARLGRSGGGAYTTADDVAQEVCLAVLTALPRYQDQGRPFSAFVFGIASHKVNDAHRGAKRDHSRPVETVPELEDGALTPETYALASDGARRMTALLGHLPPSQRDVLVLRVVVGMSADEAGQALGMTAGAVRVSQHRALAKLRQLLAAGAQEVTV